MPKTINKTISLTSEYIDILKELRDEAISDSSKLIRAFIGYFKDNSVEFQKIKQKIKNGDYDIK